MRLALTQPRSLHGVMTIECGGRPLSAPLVVPDALDAVEGVPLLAGAGQGVGVPGGAQGVHTMVTTDGHPTLPQQPLLLLRGQGPGPVPGIFPLNLDTAALIDVVY